MKKRENIATIEPSAYKAMRGLEEYIATADIDIKTKELIKIRASMINGCAYCIEMHAEKARENGETEKRIYAMSAWRESPLFTNDERCILQLTDELTRLGEHGITDDTYNNARLLFGEKKLVQILMIIITINGWNRFAIASGLEHENRSF